MIKAIIILVAVLIAAILIYAATRPDTFCVQRTTNIKASPEKIFPLINDFRQWEAWSPWEKVDPEVKRIYSGAASGTGAVYEWVGNNEISQGRLEIIESSPSSNITFKIDFIKPFAASNKIEFTLVQQGDSTKVTQAMFGLNSYLSKVMGIFFSMEEMIGSRYEEGLVNLKAIAEK